MPVFLITDRRSFRLVTGTPGDPSQTGNLTPPMPTLKALRDMLTDALRACDDAPRPASEFVYPRDLLTAPALPDRPEGAG